MKLVIEDVIARTPEVVARARALLPAGFAAEVAERILVGTAEAAERLGEQLARGT